MDYPTVYQQNSQLLKSNEKKLPDLFCKFVAAIEEFPHETVSNVELYTGDMEKRVKEYDEQYQVLLHELGVLCSKQQTKADISLVFFQNLLDFFRLAYSVYQDQPEKLEKFHGLQQDLQRFLEKGTLTIQGDVQGEPLQKALLLQLTNQAWALTSSGKSIGSVAKQVGGTLKKQNKHRTRKQKQKH